MPAQTMPPTAPARTRSGKKAQRFTGIWLAVTTSASPPPRMPPTRNCPSAPMFQTLARKASPSPTAQRMSGVALSPSSVRARVPLQGLTRKISSPRTGSFPSSAKRVAATTTVMAMATTGESTLQSRDGAGRASSRITPPPPPRPRCRATARSSTRR